jgi:hypothetical protein
MNDITAGIESMNSMSLRFSSIESLKDNTLINTRLMLLLFLKRSPTVINIRVRQNTITHIGAANSNKECIHEVVNWVLLVIPYSHVTILVQFKITDATLIITNRKDRFSPNSDICSMILLITPLNTPQLCWGDESGSP